MLSDFEAVLTRHCQAYRDMDKNEDALQVYREVGHFD